MKILANLFILVDSTLFLRGWYLDVSLLTCPLSGNVSWRFSQFRAEFWVSFKSVDLG